MGELHAKFVWPWSRRCVSEPGQALPPLMSTAARPSGPSSTLHTGDGGGFALHEALLRRVAGVSHPRVVQFPPIGDGTAAT